MKTELTVEQSQRLIELGVDPKLASKCDMAMKIGVGVRGIVKRPDPKPIFTLSDILAMLPKEIIADTIMGKDWPCAFVMRWDENRHLWVTAYETLPRPLDVGNANELIDALYNLLIWAINEKHIEL